LPKYCSPDGRFFIRPVAIGLQKTALPYWVRLVCQTASNRHPGSASKRDPLPAVGQACPGSEQEGPARVAQCPHERRSDARGRCLFAHRGKPGWHSVCF
jgi:hypothetical protein